MFKLLVTSKAKKELKQLKLIYQQAIGLAIEEIKQDPLQGKKLSRELTKRYSFKVGVYRIIYIVSFKDKVITIITAGHR